MSRILALGDNHCNFKVIKQYIPLFDEVDRVVLLGDYEDAFDVSNDDMLDSIQKILDLKKKYGEKIVLLIGNHGFPYQPGGTSYVCSGTREGLIPVLQTLYSQPEYKNFFKIAYQIDDWLFTHAGVTKRWADENQDVLEKYQDYNFAQTLNNIWDTHKRPILYQAGSFRGGIDNAPSPVWADLIELAQDNHPDFHQIVGHSSIPSVFKYVGKNKRELWFCDSLDYDKDGHKDNSAVILENGKVEKIYPPNKKFVYKNAYDLDCLDYFRRNFFEEERNQ